MTGAVVVALGALLLAAPGAEARVYDDPCPRPGETILNRPDGSQLQCDAGQIISGEETLRLNKRPAVLCSPGYRLGGDDLPLSAHWDYVTRTAWVSWTGGGARWGSPMLGYQPLVRNWFLGDWKEPVRYIHSCVRGSRGFPESEADDGVDLTGGAESDEFEGTPDDDAFAGDGGDDELAGEGGDDEQYAGAGDDRASGGPGDDELLTGLGDDESSGGPGSDSLFDDQGTDDLRGGRGGDRFSAKDGDRDRIDCGPGGDVVVADGHDRITRDCERVYTSRRDAPAKPPA
jgi:hypothetical protein